MNDIKVVIVGNIAYDVNTFFKRDNNQDKMVINRGGAGYYSLIPSSLYTKTGIVARVGNDFDIKLLESYNIDLRGLKVIKDSSTTRFHHTYLTADGQERTFSPEIHKKTLISVEDIPKEYYDAKYIHIATNFPSNQKEFVNNIRKYSNAIISIDTHEAYMEKESKFIKEIFDCVDIAFIDKEYKELLDCKAPVKIIKMGKKGCKYISKDFSFIAEVKECEVVDKTGAGDVVAGVFLAKMAETNDPVESLQTAVAIATKSIQDYGVDFLTEN